jgi:NAD-dependent histone deacetylase SIR2
MPITHLDLAHLLTSSSHADFPARRKLEDVSISIAKAKKVIVVSGAGISCSSGIPVSDRTVVWV